MCAEFTEITEQSAHKLQLTVEEKLSIAKRFKEEGNDFYRQQAYKKAIGKYHRALLYVKGVEGHYQKNLLHTISGANSRQNINTSLPKEIQEEVHKLKADCYNNLAACLLKQKDGKYEKVVQYCNEVITIAPNNIKALYRKGISYYNLGDYDQCQQTMQTAKNYSTVTDANIEKYIKLCEQHLLQYKLKEKERYKGMFDKMTEVDLSSSG